MSTLWRACSEGNLVVVLELLQDASSVDVEIKGECTTLLFLDFFAIWRGMGSSAIM